jgi:hypothetical protein
VEQLLTQCCPPSTPVWSQIKGGSGEPATYPYRAARHKQGNLNTGVKEGPEAIAICRSRPRFLCCFDRIYARQEPRNSSSNCQSAAEFDMKASMTTRLLLIVSIYATLHQTQQCRTPLVGKITDATPQ